MTTINNDLKIYILKWLYTRKNNILISKSMLPKLSDFKAFADIDIWNTIDSLNETSLVALKKITGGNYPLETISISKQGEYFLQQNQLI